MFWLFAVSVVALFIIPPAIAFWEWSGKYVQSRDVGFWLLARSVAGTCHVPWGRRGMPILRFSLPDGEGRIRAQRIPNTKSWCIELRAYQVEPFHFAARICSPEMPSLRWRAPGLEPLEVFPEDQEHLADTSFETTDSHLLRWLLRRPKTRAFLDDLTVKAGAKTIEVRLLNRVIIIRGTAPKGWSIGPTMEHLGPILVEMLRRLSSDLADLAAAMSQAGDVEWDIAQCPVCAQKVDVDPYQCKGCGIFVHRGCREMTDGCTTLDCEYSVDHLPGSQNDRNDFDWTAIDGKTSS